MRCGGNAVELVAEIDPQDAPMVELNVLRAPDKEEHTRIAFFKNRGFSNRVLWQRPPPEPNLARHFRILPVAPDVLLPCPRDRPGHPSPGRRRSSCGFFVDKSVVEVFANGQQCVAARVYPDRGDSVGVSLRAQGQSAELVSLDAYQMQDIYAE